MLRPVRLRLHPGADPRLPTVAITPPPPRRTDRARRLPDPLGSLLPPVRGRAVLPRGGPRPPFARSVQRRLRGGEAGRRRRRSGRKPAQVGVHGGPHAGRRAGFGGARGGRHRECTRRHGVGHGRRPVGGGRALFGSPGWKVWPGLGAWCVGRVPVPGAEPAGGGALPALCRFGRGGGERSPDGEEGRW